MIALLVAVSKNNVIGKDNALPWHYKKDLQYFKNLTTKQTVLMGRKTFESIVTSLGKPLPNRRNVVASKSLQSLTGAEVINDIPKFIQDFPKDQKLFIIGGKQIFDATIDYADYLYITHIDQEYSGDTYFTDYNKEDYQKIKETIQPPLSFTVYKKVKQ
jgi:dihydrofolate reductase